MSQTKPKTMAELELERTTAKIINLTEQSKLHAAEAEFKRLELQFKIDEMKRRAMAIGNCVSEVTIVVAEKAVVNSPPDLAVHPQEEQTALIPEPILLPAIPSATAADVAVDLNSSSQPELYQQQQQLPPVPEQQPRSRTQPQEQKEENKSLASYMHSHSMLLKPDDSTVIEIQKRLRVFAEELLSDGMQHEVMAKRINVNSSALRRWRGIAVDSDTQANILIHKVNCAFEHYFQHHLPLSATEANSQAALSAKRKRQPAARLIERDDGEGFDSEGDDEEMQPSNATELAQAQQAEGKEDEKEEEVELKHKTPTKKQRTADGDGDNDASMPTQSQQPDQQKKEEEQEKHVLGSVTWLRLETELKKPSLDSTSPAKAYRSTLVPASVATLAEQHRLLLLYKCLRKLQEEQRQRQDEDEEAPPKSTLTHEMKEINTHCRPGYSLWTIRKWLLGPAPGKKPLSGFSISMLNGSILSYLSEALTSEKILMPAAFIPDTGSVVAPLAAPAASPVAVTSAVAVAPAAGAVAPDTGSVVAPAASPVATAEVSKMTPSVPQPKQQQKNEKNLPVASTWAMLEDELNKPSLDNISTPARAYPSNRVPASAATLAEQHRLQQLYKDFRQLATQVRNRKGAKFARMTVEDEVDEINIHSNPICGFTTTRKWMLNPRPGVAQLSGQFIATLNWAVMEYLKFEVMREKQQKQIEDEEKKAGQKVEEETGRSKHMQLKPARRKTVSIEELMQKREQRMAQVKLFVSQSAKLPPTAKQPQQPQPQQQQQSQQNEKDVPVATLPGSSQLVQRQTEDQIVISAIMPNIAPLEQPRPQQQQPQELVQEPKLATLEQQSTKHDLLSRPPESGVVLQKQLRIFAAKLLADGSTSDQELAKKVGVHYTTIRRWRGVAGDSDRQSLETIKHINEQFQRLFPASRSDDNGLMVDGDVSVSNKQQQQQLAPKRKRRASFRLTEEDKSEEDESEEDSEFDEEDEDTSSSSSSSSSSGSSGSDHDEAMPEEKEGKQSTERQKKKQRKDLEQESTEPQTMTWNTLETELQHPSLDLPSSAPTTAPAAVYPQVQPKPSQETLAERDRVRRLYNAFLQIRKQQQTQLLLPHEGAKRVVRKFTMGEQHIAVNEHANPSCSVETFARWTAGRRLGVPPLSSLYMATLNKAVLAYLTKEVRQHSQQQVTAAVVTAQKPQPQEPLGQSDQSQWSANQLQQQLAQQQPPSKTLRPISATGTKQSLLTAGTGLPVATTWAMLYDELDKPSLHDKTADEVYSSTRVPVSAATLAEQHRLRQLYQHFRKLRQQHNEGTAPPKMTVEDEVAEINVHCKPVFSFATTRKWMLGPRPGIVPLSDLSMVTLNEVVLQYLRFEVRREKRLTPAAFVRAAASPVTVVNSQQQQPAQPEPMEHQQQQQQQATLAAQQQQQAALIDKPQQQAAPVDKQQQPSNKMTQANPVADFIRLFYDKTDSSDKELTVTVIKDFEAWLANANRPKVIGSVYTLFEQAGIGRLKQDKFRHSPTFGKAVFWGIKKKLAPPAAVVTAAVTTAVTTAANDSSKPLFAWTPTPLPVTVSTKAMPISSTKQNLSAAVTGCFSVSDPMAGLNLENDPVARRILNYSLTSRIELGSLAMQLSPAPTVAEYEEWLSTRPACSSSEPPSLFDTSKSVTDFLFAYNVIQLRQRQSEQEIAASASG